MVGQMGWVFVRPLLTVLEIAWRWIFGIPFLWVCSVEWHAILKLYPLENSGFTSLDSQNPWLAVVQLGNLWSYYAPHVFTVLRWRAPAAAIAWAVCAGLGRSIVLKRMMPSLPFRPVAMVILQAVWLVLLGGFFWGWFASVRWAAVEHISVGGEPDLVGFAMWAIFLSLGFFSAWALASWAASMAPLLLLLEKRSMLDSLAQSFRLGGPFTSKLVEVNLVMGIVKLALIVLAMVFSAAPLPFADELGPASLRIAVAVSTVFYLVANDYFQVVRLKGFIEFWQAFRDQPSNASMEP